MGENKIQGLLRSLGYFLTYLGFIESGGRHSESDGLSDCPLGVLLRASQSRSSAPANGARSELGVSPTGSELWGPRTSCGLGRLGRSSELRVGARSYWIQVWLARQRSVGARSSELGARSFQSEFSPARAALGRSSLRLRATRSRSSSRVLALGRSWHSESEFRPSDSESHPSESREFKLAAPRGGLNLNLI